MFVVLADTVAGRIPRWPQIPAPGGRTPCTPHPDRLSRVGGTCEGGWHLGPVFRLHCVAKVRGLFRCPSLVDSEFIKRESILVGLTQSGKHFEGLEVRNRGVRDVQSSRHPPLLALKKQIAMFGEGLMARTCGWPLGAEGLSPPAARN